MKRIKVPNWVLRVVAGVGVIMSMFACVFVFGMGLAMINDPEISVGIVLMFIALVLFRLFGEFSREAFCQHKYEDKMRQCLYCEHCEWIDEV